MGVGGSPALATSAGTADGDALDAAVGAPAVGIGWGADGDVGKAAVRPPGADIGLGVDGDAGEAAVAAPAVGIGLGADGDAAGAATGAPAVGVGVGAGGDPPQALSTATRPEPAMRRAEKCIAGHLVPGVAVPAGRSVAGAPAVGVAGFGAGPEPTGRYM